MNCQAAKQMRTMGREGCVMTERDHPEHIRIEYSGSGFIPIHERMAKQTA